MNRITERKGFFRRFFPAALLVFAACSCSSDANIQQILGASVEAPVFLDCKPVSPTEIVFNFSKPVRVASLNFDSGLEVQSIEEGREVTVRFAQALDGGTKITADILVEDAGRNTLNVIVPFRARNERIPTLVFNELRTDYSTSTSRVRSEFVELLALEPGNLGALRLFIAGHSLTKPIYEFPPAEVKAGEYIVLHLRTIGEGSVDETGTDITLSGGSDAQDNARDFWLPGSSKRLHRTSALWLMDQDDQILDAVLLCENPADWGRNNSAAAAEFLARSGAWLPAAGVSGDWIPGPADAVSSRGATATRTVCRDQGIPPAPRASSWYVTANSSDTPGRENSTRRYTP